MQQLSNKANKIAVEIAGWLLVIIGIAALILPGPGLLAIVAGLSLLSTRYEWAQRRLEPIRSKAFRSARESVSSWPKIFVSVTAALGLIVIGIVWGLKPAAPEWWPLNDKFWLMGGWGTGSTLIISGTLALGIIVFSYKKYRTK